MVLLTDQKSNVLRDVWWGWFSTTHTCLITSQKKTRDTEKKISSSIPRGEDCKCNQKAWLLLMFHICIPFLSVSALCLRERCEGPLCSTEWHDRKTNEGHSLRDWFSYYSYSLSLLLHSATDYASGKQKLWVKLSRFVGCHLLKHSKESLSINWKDLHWFWWFVMCKFKMMSEIFKSLCKQKIHQLPLSFFVFWHVTRYLSL